MRRVVALIAATLCSTAFQLSILFWPDDLRPYAWAVKWLWVAVGALWFIWLASHPRLWDWTKKPQPPEPTISPLSPMNNSARQTTGGNSGNIIQQVFVGRANESQAKKSEDLPRKALAQLEFVQQKLTLVMQDSRHVWVEVDHHHEPNSLIVEFVNPHRGVGEQTPRAESIVASLEFSWIDRTERLLISYGTWLNEYTYYTTFRPGETHKLIIGVKGIRKFADGSTPYMAIENPRKINPFASRRTNKVIRGTVDKHIPHQDVGYVTVRLADGNSMTLFERVFEYRITEGTMSVRPRPD
jgi:hypothetical protein